jgi:RHS repeat-associated protein
MRYARIASILLFSVIAFAQNEIPTRITNQNRIGDLPYSTSIGTDIEHVDMATGALNVNIPIWSVPGRADASLSFHWSSNYLVAASRTDSVGNAFFIYSIAADSGWQSNHPFMTEGQLAGTCQEGVPANLPPRNVFWVTHFMYHDEAGGQHLLALQKGGGLCGTSGLDTTHPDISASGMQGSTAGFGVTLADGTNVSVPTGNGQNPLFAYVGSYEDSNGNTHATNVDSLGRVLFTVVDGPRDANQNFTKTTFTVKDPNGISQNIIVNWQSLPMTTNFQTAGVEEGSFIWCAIQSIILPNGTSYQFQYEPDYGELTEIDLPTGGIIKYTWANYTYPNPANEIPSQESRRYVASRTEIVHGISNKWAFHLANLSITQDQSTVTFPPTLTVSGTTVQNQSVLISELGDLLDFSIYSGAASGTPIREYSMTYEGDVDPTLGDACAQEDTSFPTPMASRLKRLITILDNGAASKKEFDYDSLLYTFHPNHCPLKADNTAVQFKTSRGNVTAIREYGFGAVTGNPGDPNRDVAGAALLRTTGRTYLHDSNSAYVTPNIVDKVVTQTITDNVANLQVSQTQYDYDQTPIIATQNLSAVPGHDSTFTSAVTVRGNPTHVKRWNNVDGSLLTTTYNYDDLGNLRSIVDPKGNPTNWVYDDSFDSATNTCAPASNSFSYVSQKTDAAGHIFSVQRRSCTGHVHSHQDDNDVANAVKTFYTYDAMGRVLVKTLPNGGTVTNNYHGDPIPPLITTTTTADPDPAIVQDRLFDGLKRAVQTTTYGAAFECNTIVDTNYDALGRTANVSNPHCVGASPTDGVTSTIYDPLSRPLKVTKQDSSIVQTAYAGVKTTVTDETGRLRSSTVDALGRMIEVDEEATHQIPAQPGSPATSGSGSVTIAGTEQSQQVQTVPATPGSASFTISGAEKHVQAPDCPLHQSCPIYDSGEIQITVNGVNAAASYSQTQNITAAGIAQALANQINATPGMPVTATLSGSAITIKSPNGTNYGFTLGTDYDTEDFTSPSFTITPSSGTMTGGTPAQFGPSYDTGTVSVVLNGTTYSTTTGQTSTATNIASTLAASMNGALVTATSVPCSPVTSTCGAIISVTAKAQGASTDYTLSASSASTLHSFSGNASGTALTGGADAVPASPAQTVWSGVWVTQYKYDALGNLYCVEQHGDASGTPCPASPSPLFVAGSAPIPPDTSNPWRLRRFSYNSLGQLLWASNPESGVTQYAYDLDGNLSVKTSPAANQTGSMTRAISYCYDSLNRLLAKGYSNSPSAPQQCSATYPYLPTPAVVNTYDAGSNGIGHLTSLTDLAGSGIYTYDLMGRLKTEQRTTGTVSKSMSYDYNLDGGVTALHYPSGAVVTYTNQSAGRPTSAIDTVNSINYVTGPTGPGSYAKYAPDGSISSLINGYNAGFAGITSTFMNNLRLQPCRITAGTGTLPISCADTTAHGNIFDIAYDFGLGNGDNGNVLNIVNFKDTTRNQSFGYDSVNRLTSAQNAGSDCNPQTVNNKTKYWGNSYTYDEWGNLNQKIFTKCGAENLSVAPLTNNQLTGYGYDAAGNMTNDPTDLVTSVYDQENRISVATKNGVATTYVYDAAGNRVQKSNGASGTLYWYMAPGIVAESDLNGNLTSEYVFFNGERVARKDFPGNAVSYYFSDHLQTASVITDAVGTIKAESDYYPWGGELQFVNNDSNHYKFTGKERDTESGLDNYGARYYGSALGRFVTPDWSAKPVTVPYVELGDPQSLNQYAYVRNNPLSKNDPDGHCGTPSGLGPGQVGICVASYISSNTVGVIGRGDGRGPNGQGGTSRIETRLVVDPSQHTATKTNETINRSGILIKDVGPQGKGGSTVSSTQTDKEGNTYFQVSQDAHSSYSMGGAVLGSIDNHLNLAVTPDGKVGIDPGSSAKDFPSLEVYRYSVDDKGNVTTTQVFTKQESGHVSDLKQPEKPIKPQEPK